MSDGFLQGERLRLQSEQVRRLQGTGTLFLDERRRRPRFFDGRFLAARDLTREQAYFLSRQADLGRALGSGVVEGLRVTTSGSGRSLGVSAGLGITSQGETVVLDQGIALDLADVAELQTLNAAFGLTSIPSPPSRTRTGLFVLALRPVEFTTNPVASYPTRLEGPRSVEDGDIVEAVAATLIPFADLGSREELEGRRAEVARRIFVDETDGGLPAGALPVAMIALNRGVVLWLDEHMVRRSLHRGAGDTLGLGLRSRDLAEAHYHQYRVHLDDILSGLPTDGGGRRFAASEHFRVLPPVGPLPMEAVAQGDFSQAFFPPETDVELSVIPEDELAALVDRALALPAIDLTQAPEDLESTAVLVLVPVPRPMARRLGATLDTLRRPLRSAAPGLLARRKPLEQLRGLRLPLPTLPILDPGGLQDAAWAEAFAGTTTLWYVRRRNLQHKAELAGVGVRVVGDESQRERELEERMAEFRMTTRFNNLRRDATAEAAAEIVGLLSQPSLAASRVLAEGAIAEMEALERLDRASVLRVSERYSGARFGEGFRRLQRANSVLADNQNVARQLAASRAVPELDRLARSLEDIALAEFSLALEEAARAGVPEQVRELVLRRLEEIRR